MGGGTAVGLKGGRLSGRPRHPSDLSAWRATVLGMTALKQMVFSLAFAIAAVAAAQYVMWILNGQP